MNVKKTKAEKKHTNKTRWREKKEMARPGVGAEARPQKKWETKDMTHRTAHTYAY